MEIVLGVLLLFGAFTLGTVTSDHVRQQPHTAQNPSMAGDHGGPVTDVSPLPACPSRGAALPYRDLTVPAAQAMRGSATDEAHDAPASGSDD